MSECKTVLKIYIYLSFSIIHQVLLYISGGGVSDFNPVTDSRISLIFRSISVCFSVSKKNSLLEF